MGELHTLTPGLLSHPIGAGLPLWGSKGPARTPGPAPPRLPFPGPILSALTLPPISKLPEDPPHANPNLSSQLFLLPGVRVLYPQMKPGLVPNSPKTF